MEIIYIHHSGFVLLDERCSLLFDYAGGRMPDFPKDRPLYVFVSHIHADHYDSRIFELREHHPDVHFILSDDIPTVSAVDVTMVKAHRCYCFDTCTVQTLRSTDEGVGFIITIGNSSIYHAGDLNWWDWGEEDTPLESQEMEEAYRHELQKIQGQHFDIAFVPVDPRLREAATKGVRTFMEYADASHIFPMHFWEDYSIFENMKSLPFYNRIVEIHRENEDFYL